VTEALEDQAVQALDVKVEALPAAVKTEMVSLRALQPSRDWKATEKTIVDRVKKLSSDDRVAFKNWLDGLTDDEAVAIFTALDGGRR